MILTWCKGCVNLFQPAKLKRVPCFLVTETHHTVTAKWVQIPLLPDLPLVLDSSVCSSTSESWTVACQVPQSMEFSKRTLEPLYPRLTWLGSHSSSRLIAKSCHFQHPWLVTEGGPGVSTALSWLQSLIGVSYMTFFCLRV